MKELKLCPFCCGEVSIALKGEKYVQWFVTRGFGENKCTCRVFMGSDLFAKSDSDSVKNKVKNKLIEAWNRRV